MEIANIADIDSAVPGGTFHFISIFPAPAALRAGLFSFAPSAL
jgi:hypothetical protein